MMLLKASEEKKKKKNDAALDVAAQFCKKFIYLKKHTYLNESYRRENNEEESSVKQNEIYTLSEISG